MRALIVAILVAVVPLVWGCGGDGSGSSGLSHSELVARADAACRTFDARVAKVEEPESAGDFATFIGDLRSAVGAAVDDLGAIDPSPADRAAYERLVRMLAGLRDTLDQMAAAARSEDSARMDALASRVDRRLTAFRGAAQRFGLRRCAG